MKRGFRLLFFALLPLTLTIAKAAPGISHGPMLGAVSAHEAAVWVRTTAPTDVRCTMTEAEAEVRVKPETQTITTRAEHDNTCIFRFKNLKPDTRYQYVVIAGDSKYRATFTTFGPSWRKRPIRIVYGYGYLPKQDRMPPGTSIFNQMAQRKPDLVLFLGDFPYTRAGHLGEVRAGHRILRAIPGFRELTMGTPTYGIYDDHEFGPNDCDGTHGYVDEPLQAFKEYWPNPSYGEPGNKGIYCTFSVGYVQFFLLDERYPARKKQHTMLGKRQFEWLCRNLKRSKARYKVLVSGVQFGRAKSDGWAGEYYIGEREKLFHYLYTNNITGVIGISGDVHRSDIYKLPIGKNRWFYDFTPGALARVQRMPPKPMPPGMIHSYGTKDEHNMFGEIEFFPPSNQETALVFRSLASKTGVVYEHTLSPLDLGIREDE